jgi:hypothetical protein
MIETRMRNDEDRDDDQDKEAAIFGALSSSIYSMKRIPPEEESCYPSPIEETPNREEKSEQAFDGEHKHTATPVSSIRSTTVP